MVLATPTQAGGAALPPEQRAAADALAAHAAATAAAAADRLGREAETGGRELGGGGGAPGAGRDCSGGGSRCGGGAVALRAAALKRPGAGRSGDQRRVWARRRRQRGAGLPGRAAHVVGGGGMGGSDAYARPWHGTGAVGRPRGERRAR